MICRDCGEPVKWGKSQNDRWMPINLDGSNHLGSDIHRASLPYTGPLVIKAKKAIGAKPKKHCCPEVPPWELCEHQYG